MWMPNKDRLLCLWLFLLLTIPLEAQQIAVTDFHKLRRLWPLPKGYPTDKKQAWLDLATTETDFTFLANGQTPVEAQPGEGLLTLLLPHKTRFVVIQHPQYGLYTWKVPGKPLRKKKHYQATLVTFDAEKAYELKKQWVVFHVSPGNALLWVDSTMTAIRTGTEQFFLPLGQHTYRIEAPFYRTVMDTFRLDDSGRTVIRAELQPAYAYLTVRTPHPQSPIYVDGTLIGWGKGESGRLEPGPHRLCVKLGPFRLYDRDIILHEAEKKELNLGRDDLLILPLEKARPKPGYGNSNQPRDRGHRHVAGTTAHRRLCRTNKGKRAGIKYHMGACTGHTQKRIQPRCASNGLWNAEHQQQRGQCGSLDQRFAKRIHALCRRTLARRKSLPGRIAESRLQRSPPNHRSTEKQLT